MVEERDDAINAYDSFFRKTVREREYHLRSSVFLSSSESVFKKYTLEHLLKKENRKKEALKNKESEMSGTLK